MIKEKLYSVLDGNEPALKTYVEFKRMETDLKEAMEAIKDQALEEAKKHGKNFELEGVHIEVRNTAGKWIYKHVPEWNELSSKMESLEDQLKHSYKAKATLVNEETGEVILPAQYVEGKETLFISLKTKQGIK